MSPVFRAAPIHSRNSAFVPVTMTGEQLSPASLWMRFCDCNRKESQLAHVGSNGKPKAVASRRRMKSGELRCRMMDPGSPAPCRPAATATRCPTGRWRPGTLIVPRYKLACSPAGSAVLAGRDLRQAGIRATEWPRRRRPRRIAADHGQQMRLARFWFPDELICGEPNLRGRGLLSLFKLCEAEAQVCILHSSMAVRPSGNATASS